jgi:hypothetical protein
MNAVSYRHYLDLLENRPGSPLFHKILIFLLAAVLIGVGTLSAVFYKYQKDAPLRGKYEYLETAKSDYESSRQSINEVLAAFRVAGDKVSIVDALQEAQTQSQGFFVALDDIEKNLSKIEATKNNISAKKDRTENQNPPGEFTGLHNQLIDFYGQSLSVLSDIYKDHLFAKELLLASGPKFYLPALSDENIWESGNELQITQYYSRAKEDADIALKNYSRLSPPPHFQSYYDAQVTYLTILVNLSDNIINTLSVGNDQNLDSATQIEKAYQLFVGAERESETVSRTLLAEKLKLVDIKENLNKLAPIELKGNSLEENLVLAYAQTTKVAPPNFYLDLIFSRFLSL